jgi:peptide deformylase
MPLREVLQFPDKRLTRVSARVDEVTDEIRQLASDMLEVMYDEPGIGLAAPQVGVAVRLIVVDTQWTEEDSERDPRVLLNPEITAADGSVTWNEGCLSVPDFEADVERSERVTLEAVDLAGNTVKVDAEGIEAVCFQHEIDHLDGKLFIDRISRLKREMYVRKRKKQLRQDELEAG